MTVGIPSYNRCRETQRAIGSALSQSYRPVRIVVSDNASDDGTQQVVQALADEHVEVVARLGDTNVGPTANFERLRGEADDDGYFMWLGDDDWLGDDVVGACARVLDDDPSVVVAAPTVRYHGPDGEWLEDPPVSLLDDDAAARVLGYYRSVGANGVFYGLARVAALSQVPTLSNDMGGDWTHVASLAFLGRVRTLPDVELHRSVGGATRSLTDVAGHLGLGWLSRQAPQLAIAWHTFVEIGVRSPVFAALGRPARAWLGLRAAAVILQRFLPGAIAKFVRQRTVER